MNNVRRYDSMGYSKEKATAGPVQIKPLINGGRRIVTDTTNTKEHTEQAARKKGTPFLVEADLRDYFAAKALQGICSSGPGGSWTDDMLACEAYRLADAMLKAREVKRDNQ